MSGSAFETCMQDIARRKKDNGGPSLEDVLNAVIAANDDRREATADTDKRLLNLSERLELHLADKPSQTATQSLLEHERESVADRRELAIELAAYKQQVKAAVDAVAVELVAYRANADREPRRKSDPPDVNSTTPDVNYRPAATEMEGDMQRAWRVGRWFVMALVVASMAFGLSYWADSCSRTNYWGPAAPIMATPAPTPTQ